uniref:DENN domain containing 2B n=1 Tax=Scleropages formosus TaxID=113540 RepID=A0A8C9VQW6_SCLFO
RYFSTDYFSSVVKSFGSSFPPSVHCFPRYQSTSPPPDLSNVKGLAQTLSDSEEGSRQNRYSKASDEKPPSGRPWSSKSASLRPGLSCPSDLISQGRLPKAESFSCLDSKLSNYKQSEGEGDQEKKENGQEAGAGSAGWSTLSLIPASVRSHHQRTLSLGRPVTCHSSAGIRKRISEWECRREALTKMSLCIEKRQLGERGGGSEVCSSLLSSPCSDKTFDFKGIRRTSMAFSECSYPETEEEEVATASDRECLGRFEKRPSKTEATGLFLRSFASRKDTSAVLNRIQKIEQALKESPSPNPPQYPSSCYAPENLHNKRFTIGGPEESYSVRGAKRGSIVSVATEMDAPSDPDGLVRLKQQGGMCSNSPELASLEMQGGLSVNPVPKPKRTFEYEANHNHNSTLPSNGLPPSSLDSPPPLPSTPPPSRAQSQKVEGSPYKRVLDRESCESEDAASLPSSYPSSPTENGTASPEVCSRPSSKSTLEENAYEDIAGELSPSHKENPYEDVDLKGRAASRKSKLLLQGSRDSLNRMWTSQGRKFTTPPQLPSKPNSQALRLPGAADRKCHRIPRLSKRRSRDDLLPPPSPCGLLDGSLSGSSHTLASHRPRRVPKLVRRINSIYSSKRGKKRLKKLSLSNIETASLRGRDLPTVFPSQTSSHAQRLQKLQSLLQRAPSYRTLEMQLIEWQERELFEYFVVVSLKKKPAKNSYVPEVTYQFPKLERPTKQMREAEQRLKAIPHFCFPDAKDWSPVLQHNSETFSFMLTGEDGSRRFGYCRRLLPSGKGPRLPEVYCIISRLGCFDLFSKILDEVERRRSISAALVYPFMRSLMESPFPAPGKTIRVKTFLPGAGNEVMELKRPMDSRLEHVDLESLFCCLSVRQVVRVFASLLLERRVIFVADKLSTLSSCAHAVIALLYPFSWQHTFIPVLPSSMVDIVCCPTPFLVGLLSSSLPKLKELPVEEALMVDLRTDRFIRQMDDEAALLPRKLQSALEQALEHRIDIVSQDSDSESDEECSSMNSVVSEAFIRFFLETIGHYSLFLTQNERGERVFQREAFRKSVASKSIRRFLGVFMESQMFAGFIQDRELRKSRARGLFEERVEQYLEELPDTEQSGVNKFLKDLSSKMKFLHKKN